MRILEELLNSTEGQFAIAVIGFMLAMGIGLAIVAMRKSRSTR